MGDSAARRISGVWYNQLGSRVELRADEGGTIAGTVESSVGGARGSHRLTGSLDVDPLGSRGALGFAVRWDPVHSVTVWAGHYDLDREVIDTTWLLSGAPYGHDEWRSTLVGHDSFVRERPAPVGHPGWASGIPS